ncbi:hypothetical protein JXJ21_04935 [candidate division KSB1 bacterium]|nr:hypothetical protein [candidate division KSB1 bacterium]
MQIPYPKIDKKVPQFLTSAEFKLILKHFTQKATNLIGLRNLVIISLLGLLGLRTATVVAINIEDVNLTESRLWIHEKGFAGMSKKLLSCPESSVSFWLNISTKLNSLLAGDLHSPAEPMVFGIIIPARSKPQLQSPKYFKGFRFHEKAAFTKVSNLIYSNKTTSSLIFQFRHSMMVCVVK